MFVRCTFRSFHVYITHATDKHMDKLAKSEIIIVFMNYSPFALPFNDIYSTVRNLTSENVFNFVTKRA